MGGVYTRYGICRLDCIVTVVDALRLQSEFACDSNLCKGLDEEDMKTSSYSRDEFVLCC